MKNNIENINEIFLICIDKPICRYVRLPGKVDGDYTYTSKFISGSTIYLKKNEHMSKCENYCDALNNCQSFNYQMDGSTRSCGFYTGLISGNEPLMCGGDIYGFTVYKKCGEGNASRMIT